MTSAPIITFSKKNRPGKARFAPIPPTTAARCTTTCGERSANMRRASASFPGTIDVVIGFDEGLAHLVQAAADIMLVPSRFEPCGLTPLYSMRYGTVPIASRVGGLMDTITDHGSPEAISFFTQRVEVSLPGNTLMKCSCGMPHLSTTILRSSRS